MKIAHESDETLFRFAERINGMPDDDPQKPSLIYGDSRIKSLPHQFKKRGDTLGEMIVHHLASFFGFGFVAACLGYAIARAWLEIRVFLKILDL